MRSHARFIKGHPRYAFLAGLWIGSMLLCAERVNLTLIHPQLAGPRYFFLPFVLLSRLVVVMMTEADTTGLRLAAAMILILSIVNARPVWTRKHANFRWTEHLVSCGHFEAYQIPFSYDGYTPWFLSLDRSQCDSLQHLGVIASGVPKPGEKSYPYRMIPIDSKALSSVFDERLASTSAVATDGWRGTDYVKSQIPGLRVIGSERERGDGDEGALTMRLHRGDRVLFRAGPTTGRQTISIQNGSSYFDYVPNAPDWILLEFSNNTLPEEFTVVFSDKGSGWGEWSAVAVRAEGSSGHLH